MEEMASMTRQNAENADGADRDMRRATTMVNDASTAMSKLEAAMREIRASSEESSKIVTNIDAIAFQTNLLSLNAAVEAARAGQVGAGFAVVAGEVRTLALRAAEAAKNTAAIIQETEKKVAGGVEGLADTKDTFNRLKETIDACAERINEIASASDEQARGLEQVNSAVVEVDSVVQRNASFSEETASASEEMYAHATQMVTAIRNLARLVQGGRRGRTEDVGAPSNTVDAKSARIPEITEETPKQRV